jgi:hypothetical protein
MAVAYEQAAELSMLCGFDDDLAQQATAASNRIRGLLTQIHPAVEPQIGPHLDHPSLVNTRPLMPCEKQVRPGVAALLGRFAPRAVTLGCRAVHGAG